VSTADITQLLDDIDIDRLRAFARSIWFGIEGNLLTFTQRLDAGSLKRGDMDEDVLGSIRWRDETEPLVDVKEFHSTLCHLSLSQNVGGETMIATDQKCKMKPPN
jgi:hypothetical protein